MIELKDITTVAPADGNAVLQNYSLQVNGGGEVCVLHGKEGRAVIQVLLGFLAVERGYVSFDGMLLTAKSATFLRRTVAYVPEPMGFEDAEDLQKKQYEMLDKAINSDCSVLLAINPFSHQPADVQQLIAQKFKTLANKGKVVIVAAEA